MEENKNVQLDVEQEMPKNKQNVNGFDKFFGISAKGSTIGKEIIAGFVTFLAMVYILIVNPDQILFIGTKADPMWASIFIATAFGAIIGTLLMGLFARMPLAQAPGLGLNSTVGAIIGGMSLGGVSSAAYGGLSFTFANAMLLVFISGLLFLLLSVVPCRRNKETGKLVALREAIFDGMPYSVRKGISVGIGLFSAFIGLQNANFIVFNQYTLVQLVDFRSVFSGNSVPYITFDSTVKMNVVSQMAPYQWAAGATVFGVGFLIISILSHYKVKGAVIIGIIAGTLLALPLGVTSIDYLKGTQSGISWEFWKNFENFFKPTDQGGVAFSLFTEGFNFPANSFMTCVMIVITFCMIDMFDTMGTVVGCTESVGLVDENGKPLNYNKIMISDSVATCTGALLGTSTVTTFVESGTGIAAGGRTGLTAVVVAALFFLSIFLLPVFAFIPKQAAAAALVYVGVLMMGNVTKIDFKNPMVAVPAFITIIMMPLTYSITTGIGLGMIVYVVMNLVAYIVDLILYKFGKKDKPKWNISIVSIIVFLLFLVYFFVPTTF